MIPRSACRCILNLQIITLVHLRGNNTMESLNVPELVARLGSDEESVRKMAVFKLQSAIGDPSFADVFIQEGGLPKLRFLALHSTGNTLAYCLTSLSRLLELDKGWDYVTDDLTKRVSTGYSRQSTMHLI